MRRKPVYALACGLVMARDHEPTLRRAETCHEPRERQALELRDRLEQAPSLVTCSGTVLTGLICLVRALSTACASTEGDEARPHFS